MGLLLLLASGGVAAGALAMAAVAERARFNARRQRTSTSCVTADVSLAPTPIEPAWLLDGSQPLTEAATLARNDDGTTAVYLWQTTRARFRWVHESDEIVTVLAGEVFLADVDESASAPGPERRLGFGDVAFFPAGTRTVWRVPDHLRKVSTLVRPLPGPAASALRWMRALKRGVAQLAQARRRAPETSPAATPNLARPQ